MSSDDEILRARIKDLVRAAEVVEKGRRQEERDLHHTKWFDFRFMSPVDATRQFAQHYEEQFKAAWRRNFDLEDAAKKRPLPSGDLLNTQNEWNAMWRARQAADVLGIPYEL